MPSLCVRTRGTVPHLCPSGRSGLMVEVPCFVGQAEDYDLASQLKKQIAALQKSLEPPPPPPPPKVPPPPPLEDLSPEERHERRVGSSNMRDLFYSSVLTLTFCVLGFPSQPPYARALSLPATATTAGTRTPCSRIMTMIRVATCQRRSSTHCLGSQRYAG